MIASFILLLALFTAIGLWSASKSSSSKRDYYLAGSGIRPWLVGLSAAATCNSGYMFIGLIGYTYTTGLAAVWIMIGLVGGDFLASLYVHSRLRRATSETGELSYAGVLSAWNGRGYSTLQALIGLVSLIFLIAYAAAQLIAGGKTLHVLLDWPVWSGALISAVLVSAYCFSGGIRASVWTDAAQSAIMILAMAALLVAGIAHTGGIAPAVSAMQSIPNFTAWAPQDDIFPGMAGVILFAVGWLFAGLSVIGQPHIMVRFMILDQEKHILRARAWYYLWYLVFFAMAICVGMLSRVYLGNTGDFDAELALPTMAQKLLPPILVGFVLAGVFAATMSTADSLILSCSAAITHDILPRRIEKTGLLKLSTVSIAALALSLALSNNQNVFDAVILAWSGLASAFAPLLIALCMGFRPAQYISLASVIAGFSVALLWRVNGLHEAIYEGLPGIATGLTILVIAHTIDWRKTGQERPNP